MLHENRINEKFKSAEAIDTSHWYSFGQSQLIISSFSIKYFRRDNVPNFFCTIAFICDVPKSKIRSCLHIFSISQNFYVICMSNFIENFLFHLWKFLFAIFDFLVQLAKSQIEWFPNRPFNGKNHKSLLHLWKTCIHLHDLFTFPFNKEVKKNSMQ